MVYTHEGHHIVAEWRSYRFSPFLSWNWDVFSRQHQSWLQSIQYFTKSGKS